MSKIEGIRDSSLRPRNIARLPFTYANQSLFRGTGELTVAISSKLKLKNSRRTVPTYEHSEGTGIVNLMPSSV